MCLSLSIQVQDPGPISHLEAKGPSEWSTLVFWYPMAPKPTGGSSGEGRRPVEWIKEVGEEVAWKILMEHDLLKLGKTWLGAWGYSALSLFVFAL